MDPRVASCEVDERLLCLVHGALEVHLGPTSVCIGRDEDCALSLSSHLVSRFHAMIEAAGDGQSLLRDLDSTNGTYLNGLRLSSGETFPLREHDVIEVGPERILVASAERLAARSSAPADPGGSDHDLADLVRDGHGLIPAEAVVALEHELEAAVRAGRLEDALGVVNARLSARVILLCRGAPGAEAAPIASHPAALAAGVPVNLFTAAALGALAARAIGGRRGLLVHGHGRQGDEPHSPEGETSVHGQWSAAAVPLDPEREGPRRALVVGRTGRNRLDRRDLAVLAVLAERVAPALRAVGARAEVS